MVEYNQRCLREDYGSVSTMEKSQIVGAWSYCLPERELDKQLKQDGTEMSFVQIIFGSSFENFESYTSHNATNIIVLVQPLVPKECLFFFFFFDTGLVL